MATFNRNKIWKDNETFWSDEVKKSPGVSSTHDEMAKIYLEKGAYEKAIQETKKSFELDPRIVFFKYWSSYASLEEMKVAGLLGLIGIALVMVFGFRLKPPEKDE